MGWLILLEGYESAQGPTEDLADENAAGHVNNVTYIRYAESARIKWAQNFAKHIDPKHQKEWS